MTGPTAPHPERLRLIKLIHVAKRELRMDDETYRTMLRTAGKADSTTAMGVPALMRVLEHAKKAGFRVRSKAGQRSQDSSPAARKVRALWLFLHTLGVVQNPSEAALAAYVKRIVKVDDMRWASGGAMHTLIETMKKWAMRFLPEAVAALRMDVHRQAQTTPLTQGELEACRSAHAACGAPLTFDGHWKAWEIYMTVLGREVLVEVRQTLEKAA